jgi:hypothetical protein
VRKRVFELVKAVAGPAPERKRRGRPPGSGRKEAVPLES